MLFGKRPLLGVLALICFLPLFLSGCADPVGEAEFLVARGELEQAEAKLGDEEGRRAHKLRTRITALREERIETEQAISAFIVMAADGDMKKARLGLRRLSKSLYDFRAKESVDRASSDLADLAAAEVSRRTLKGNGLPQGTTVLPGEPEEDVREREVALVNSMIERIIGHVEDSASDKDWVRARSLIKMAVSSSGEHAERLNQLLVSVEAQGRADMESLFAEATKIQGDRGPDAAFNFLAAEASRFPQSGTLAAYYERMDEIGKAFNEPADVATEVAAVTPDKVREPRRSPKPVKPVKPKGPSMPSMPPSAGVPTAPAATPTAEADENATELFVNATKLEEQGALALARDEWERVSEAFPRGTQRRNAQGHVSNLEARLALRHEVAEAVVFRADYFALLGVESVDDSVFVVHGESVRWNDVEDELFERAVLLATLSEEGHVGWIQELWVRGDEDAPHELAAALARDEVTEAQAWTILAGARGESTPEEGYAYTDGEWFDRGAARLKALEGQLSAWEKKLAKANSADRDEHYAVLLEQGRDARSALEAALETRWTNAYSNLERGATIAQVEKLAEQRTILDGKRKNALDLIFNEEEYFYPYNPPECPPDKARLYPAVQRRVDELVGEVNAVWSAPKSVSLPKKFRAAIEELAWNRARQAELGLSFEKPVELPPWVAGLDLEANEVDLHGFAWDANERKARVYDDRVQAFNEHIWETYEAAEDDETSEASNGAQEQVRITNAYRMMFGRRALSWNARIQVAAQGHSDWMSKTGKFSHFNDEDANRTTPGDRMRLAGYNSGISENLHLGGSGPEGAHRGWASSSGHHRNLLMPGHREMASAAGGQYWTQNFGIGQKFLEELKAWYD